MVLALDCYGIAFFARETRWLAHPALTPTPVTHEAVVIPASTLFRRQRLWDKIGVLSNGGFLAHRNPKESEDEPEILRPTHAGASRKAGPPIFAPQ